MMRTFFLIVFLSLLFFASGTAVSAEYVLPYPSAMPGNKLYKITRITDRLKNYWNIGNIAQVKYRLSLGDKYLVEAKTLFEYKQYLLATDALARSDTYIDSVFAYVQAASDQGKDMSVFRKNIQEAMLVHMVVIANMKKQLPEEFIWRPEKKAETKLDISSLLSRSVAIRQTLHDHMIVSSVSSNTHPSQ
jgi:hypothetical protein